MADRSQKLSTLLFFSILAQTPVLAASGQLSEAPDSVIPTIIRREGFPCERPIEVKRDDKRSMPDKTAWLVSCKGVTYRVHLLPHSFSPIEVISAEDQ